MIEVVCNKHLSTPRTKKFRENMIKHGFKRVQKWVFDLESSIIQQQMKEDLKNYKHTQEISEWNNFAIEELANMKEWK